MRLGVMVGPERGRYATKVERMVADVTWADQAGFASAYIPHIPDDFDAMIAATVMGAATERIELCTAVVPAQPRHPLALAQQALSVQAVCGGRFSLGIGPSHHWIIEDMLGLSYDRPAALTRDYVEVLQAALSGGPGPVDVDNEHYRVHNPLDVTDLAPTPVLLAALGPAMLRLAGERADGTLLWLADERAIGEHIAPRINAAAAEAGRPAPRVVAGIAVCLCADAEVDDARDRANRVLSEATISPNYQRLLDHGDSQNVGDMMAVGSEEAVIARLQGYVDAGATDLSIRVMPMGKGRDELLASSARTREFLADLTPGV